MNLQNLNSNRLTRAALLALGFTLSSLLLIPATTASSQAKAASAFQVMSVDNTAWVTRKATAVKATLKLGDELQPGDRLDVFPGNHVQIAIGKPDENIIHVEGPSVMTVSETGLSEIEMTTGVLFAMLDELGADQGFRVNTPTAVATVRGTRFEITVRGLATDVLTHEGAVHVYGRNAQGEASEEYTSVKAGQSARFASYASIPAPAAAMTPVEKARGLKYLRKIRATQKRLKGPGVPEKTEEIPEATVETTSHLEF